MAQQDSKPIDADVFGVICSVGCAIHCGATPILLAFLPSISGIRWLASPLFHQVVAILCAILVYRAIVPKLRMHRDWRVGTFAGVGLSLLFVAAFVLPDQCCSGHHDAVEAAQVSNDSGAQAAGVSTTASKSVCNHPGCTHHHGATTNDEKTLASDADDAEKVHAAALFSTVDLYELFGSTVADRLISWQPYLTPIGGVFLILAHLLNLRHGFCRIACCE